MRRFGLNPIYPGRSREYSEMLYKVEKTNQARNGIYHAFTRVGKWKTLLMCFIECFKG